MIWLLHAFISAEFWVGAVVAFLAVVVLSRVEVPFASRVLRQILFSGTEKK